MRSGLTQAMLLATTLAVAVVCPAHAAPPAWEPALRRELATVLSPAELERLLASRFADDALADLFEGWDGQGDVLRVARTAAGIELSTTIRDRHCTARLARPETPIEAPVCEDATRPGGQRSATFTPDTYAPKPRRPRPPAPPAAHPTVADAGHPADAATPPEPDPTVMQGSGRAHRKDDAPDVVTAARIEHDGLVGRLRGPHKLDPLLPKALYETNDALKSMDWEPIVETAVNYHLKNPFDEARMRTADPMPNEALTALGTSLDAPPPLPDLRPECVEQWSKRELTADPPTLDCYRRVAFHARLGKKDLHAALGPLASIVSLPVLDLLLAQEVQSAVSPLSHGPVWAMVWLEWVRDNPERTAEALGKLTTEERRLVRRRFADWWFDPGFAPWRPTITALFERHFIELYPESKGSDGLPQRTFVTDTWLWANNWLATVDLRDEPAIVAAYERLPAGERRVIDAFVQDGGLRGRFTKAAEVLARL
ncbi:MAG: hypothetical protein U1F43_01515 [Myxococcota bacterium]